MLMDTLLTECKTLLENTDFASLYESACNGMYSPNELIDIALAVIFLMVEGDEHPDPKDLEVVSKALSMLRGSMLEDKDERFPMTVIGLKHIICCLERTYDRVKRDRPSANAGMYM